MSKDNKKHHLSQADMVLISMYRVSQGTKEKVPWEEVVLQAWRNFPNDFSLRNHPEYPDGEVIHKRIADRLKPGGLVVSLGNRFYRLTDRGVEFAKRLVAAIEGAPIEEGVSYRYLSRDEEQFIRHAVSSQAFGAWKNDQAEKLIDYDAKLFFRFSTGTKIEERKLKVEFARDAIKKANQIGISGADQVDQLAEFLVNTFSYLFEEEK